MPELEKLRLRFEKTGRAVYISHLDLMRTLQRAFLRAGLPLKYSEGFNPHAQISILLPLSLGMSSRCELMDFKLNQSVPLAEIPERLNAALPEGVRALEAYSAQRKSKELKWLHVSGKLDYDGKDAAALLPALEAFFARPALVITKKTKRGEGESDIAPAIREIRFTAEGEAVRLEAVLSAQEPTLNPELLVSALRQLQPALSPDFARFERTEVYDREMSVFR